ECSEMPEMARRNCSFCPLAVTGSIVKRIELGLAQSRLLARVAPLPSFSVKVSVFDASSNTSARLALHTPPSRLHSLSPSADFPSARLVKVTAHSRGAGHSALSRPMYL